MSLQAQLDAANKQIAELKAGLERMSEGQKNAKEATDSLAGAINNLTSMGAKGTTQVRDSTDAYQNLIDAYEATGNVFSKVTAGLGAGISQFGAFGKIVGGTITAVGGITSAFTGMAAAVGKLPKTFIEGMDTYTRGLRSFEAGMFDMEKRFGGTIGQAKDFSDSMRKASSNPLAKSLHMTTNEMAGLVRATKNSSLTQKQLSQVVQTGAGAIELYGAATAFAASSGLDLSDGARILNDLMNKQGKTAQEATNMMGLYIGVAEESGLSIDTVAGSLNSAVEQFKKIGMAADFGAPILKGFTKTVDEMGLGIENAVGLSASLTQALAGLTNNYAMAHLTFQRGGLDIGGGGGGGVLGSSIALQAAYLDAEKTGDQSAISNELVRGMRDTLASFTGGEIVTVSEAAEDSSLQNQFYVQQQMLKSNYGVGDENTASRILELLSQLDDATRMGDEDAQKKLSEQIQKETQGRDKTLDEMTKMNRQLEAQTNLLAVQTRSMLDQTRRAAAGTRRAVTPAATAAVDLAQSGINAAGGKMKGLMDGIGVSPLDDPVLQNAISNLRSGSAGSPVSMDPAAANMFASRAAMGPNGDLSDTTYKNQFERSFGRDLDRQGSKVLGSEIEALASIVASQAAPASIQGGAGGREALKRQFASELREALENLNIKVDLSQRAAGNLTVAQNIGAALTTP